MLFSYHLLYFCTALSLIIMLSSHYHHHKSKTFSQLTQCPFTGTLLLFNLLTIIVYIFLKTEIYVSDVFCGAILFFSHKTLFIFHITNYFFMYIYVNLGRK